MLPQILKNLGLDEREIRIFLQAAHQKLAPVSQIAKKAGLKRTTCYQIIENLVKRKFIKRYIQHGIKYYAAATPEELQQLLSKMVAPFDEARGLLTDTAELKKFYNIGRNDTQIAFYEGYEEIKLAYDKILDQGDGEIYSLLRKEDSSAHPLKKYWEKYLRRRLEQGKKSYSMVPAEPQSKTYLKDSTRENRRTLSIRSQDLPITGDLKVCGDLIALISQNEGRIFGLTIENPETAAMFKGMLKILWKHFSKAKKS